MNDLLRDHVTRVGFNLTLGKTHIETLTYLADWGDVNPADIPRTPASFVGAGHGLMRRGLLVHIMPPNRDEPNYRPPGAEPLGTWWKITPAGQLVLGLLEEAGIWTPRRVEVNA